MEIHDAQSLLQDHQNVPKRLPDASKTPYVRSKMLVRCSKKLLPCQVHAKSLPVSKICQRCLSPVAKHDGRPSIPWPLTKGSLAVVRPRGASILFYFIQVRWRHKSEKNCPHMQGDFYHSISVREYKGTCFFSNGLVTTLLELHEKFQTTLGVKGVFKTG